VDTSPRALAIVASSSLLVAAALTYSLIASAPAALVAGGFAAAVPVSALRARRDEGRSATREAWPSIIEEIRLQCGAVGRSIPQALFDAGRRTSQEMRRAFAAAEKEWSRSTDFSRALTALKEGLSDPTADAVCETLVVANELGGTDVDARLAALAEDRRLDAEGRKDARSKQAGVRFSRRFVLLVPAGMAVAGMSIGEGRAAYTTPFGQLAVVVGIGAVFSCWMWAGRMMHLPEEKRVFGG
jgi:tight adherence protein B